LESGDEEAADKTEDEDVALHVAIQEVAAIMPAARSFGAELANVSDRRRRLSTEAVQESNQLSRSRASRQTRCA
jgi:hypothetical protein